MVPSAAPVFVLKANGEKAAFSEEKLRRSLANAGAPPSTIGFIIRQVEKELYDGIPTRKIYRMAFELLKKDSRSSAARYKLKRAIMELGPSGYPFEKYIGALLEDQGYDNETGVITMGQCVKHEVDVLGERNGTRIAVECKFGNTPSKKIDVKVALYIWARFKDLEAKWSKEEEHADKKFEGWIVTNGIFSEDAIQYGNCVGLHLVAWNYPHQGNLKDWIDMCQLHPITSLTTLKKAEKQILIDKGLVMCRELLNEEHLKANLHLTTSRKRKLLEEVEGLCGG